MPEESPKKIVIIDDDNDLLEKLQTDENFDKVPIEVVSDSTQAIGYIKENAGSMYALFLSPNIARPGSLSIIKVSMTCQPLVPIYYLESMKTDDEGVGDDDKIALAGRVAKPFVMKDLLSKISDQVSFFCSESALKIAEKFSEKVDQEIHEDDPSFLPIRIDQFLSGSKSFFDVYVKIRKDKYVKVLQAGDKFERERIDYYVEKGVLFLFIRKDVQKEYADYCDRLTSGILKAKKLPLNQKMAFVFNQAEVTLNSFHELGVSNESLVHAQKFIKNTGTLVSQMCEEDDVLKSLLSSLMDFEHVAGVIALSSMVAKASRGATGVTSEILGLAGLFHDVAFALQKDDEVDYEAVGKVNYSTEGEVAERLNSGKCFGAEKTKLENIYREHAQLSADEVGKSESVNKTALQIIRQHHSHDMKLKGTYEGGQIHPLSSILEISDEVIHILASLNQGRLDPAHFKRKLSNLGDKYPLHLTRTLHEVFNIKL